MNTYNWYSTLIKPTWAPPSWLFGPVWTVLYIIIAITFGTVFYRAYQGQIPWMVALPYALNLVFNFAFTPIQFGLKNNLLASVDIFLYLAHLSGHLPLSIYSLSNLILRQDHRHLPGLYFSIFRIYSGFCLRQCCSLRLRI